MTEIPEKTLSQQSEVCAPVAAERRESAFWSWAILALFALFVLMSLANTGQEWLNHHQGWNGARRSLAAKNYERYGYIDSKLGTMDNLGEHRNAAGKADKYEYFWHHPPMTNLLVSFAFALFGESPAVARLLAACLSWTTFLFLFLALKRLWGREAAFYSLFFLSFIPIYCTYLNFVNHETVVLFSMCGMIVCYEQYLKSGRRVFAALVFVFMFIGSFADFPMFPFLFFFWLLTGLARLSGKPRNYGFHLLYVAMVFLTLALVVLHLASMQDSTSEFYKLFINRHQMPQGNSENLYLRLLKHWDYYYAFFSPLAYVLSVVYFADLLIRLARGQANRGDAYALSFLSAGLIYVFALKVASIIHEYTVLYTVPFFAMASGFALYRLRVYFSKFSRGFAFAFAVLSLLSLFVYTAPKFFVKASNPIYSYSRSIDAVDSALKYDYELDYNIIATMLRESSRPDDLALILTGGKIRREFHYYADRRFKGIKSPADFFSNSRSGKYARLLVHAGNISSAFLEYLAGSYNFIQYGQFYIFDLRGDFKFSTAKRKLVHTQNPVARYFHSLVHNTYDIVDDPAASLNLAIQWNKRESIEYWSTRQQQPPNGIESALAAYNYGRISGESPDIKTVEEFVKPPRKERGVDSIDYHGYLIKNLPDGRSELTLVFSCTRRIEAAYNITLNGKPAAERNEDSTIRRVLFNPVPTDMWHPGLLYSVSGIINLKYGIYDLSFDMQRKDNYTLMNLKDGSGELGINCNMLSDEKWQKLAEVSTSIDAAESHSKSSAELLSGLSGSFKGIKFSQQQLGNGLELLGCFSHKNRSVKGNRHYDLRIFVRKVADSPRNLDLTYTHTSFNAKSSDKKSDDNRITITVLKALRAASAVVGQTIVFDSIVSGDPSYGAPRLQLTGREPGVLRNKNNRARVNIAVARTGVRQPFAWIQKFDIARGLDDEKKKD